MTENQTNKPISARYADLKSQFERRKKGAVGKRFHNPCHELRMDGEKLILTYVASTWEQISPGKWNRVKSPDGVPIASLEPNGDLTILAPLDTGRYSTHYALEAFGLYKLWNMGRGYSHKLGIGSAAAVAHLVNGRHGNVVAAQPGAVQNIVTHEARGEQIYKTKAPSLDETKEIRDKVKEFRRFAALVYRLDSWLTENNAAAAERRREAYNRHRTFGSTFFVKDETQWGEMADAFAIMAARTVGYYGRTVEQRNAEIRAAMEEYLRNSVLNNFAYRTYGLMQPITPEKPTTAK